MVVNYIRVSQIVQMSQMVLNCPEQFQFGPKWSQIVKIVQHSIARFQLRKASMEQLKLISNQLNLAINVM